MALGKMLNKVKEQSEQLKEKSSKFSFSEINLKELGLEKIKSTINDLNEALPVIKKAGYSVSEVEIEMGIPPSIVIHFYYEKSITDEEKSEILKEIENNKISLTLLNSLFKATAMQEMINLGNLKFKEIEVN